MVAAMTSIPLALMFAVLTTANPIWSTNATVGMPVETTSGTIVGHSSSEFQPEYLGIPFAVPPVGNLRWTVPQRFGGTTQIVADKQPLSCAQGPASVNYSLPLNWQHRSAENAAFANVTSEDCLYLNVWTKYPSSGTCLKPVIIWIFGGGFSSGSASDPTQQGGIFAEEQDVVMVNINYRLSIFGFPGATNTAQNLGLLDQRLAIEWVRDNIAAFGGDPHRITIWGHSAGGASVDYYNYAYTQDPIISGSIMGSGSATSFGNRLPNTTLAGWDKVASLLNCTGSDDAALSCLRSKDTSDVFKASVTAEEAVIATLGTSGQELAGITGLFGPTIDNVTVFPDYTELGNAGKFIQAPVLTGSNDDEGCFFAMTGKIPVSEEGELTTRIFTCPVYHAAEFRKQHDVSTWKYRYFGAYPNVYAPACPGRPWHGQEVDVIFGSTKLSTGENATKMENEVGRYFRQALTAFARDTLDGPTEEMGWPSLTAAGDSLTVLGLNTTLMADWNATVYDASCNAADSEYGQPNF